MVAIERRRYPIPGIHRPPDPRRKYPWIELKVGQSFFVNGTRKRASLQVQAIHAGKAYDRKFVTRTMNGGVRIWRIK